MAVLFYIYLAGWTGLEPATSSVTGRCSNQLNYQPKNYSSKNHFPLLIMYHFTYFGFFDFFSFFSKLDAVMLSGHDAYPANNHGMP